MSLKFLENSFEGYLVLWEIQGTLFSCFIYFSEQFFHILDSGTASYKSCWIGSNPFMIIIKLFELCLQTTVITSEDYDNSTTTTKATTTITTKTTTTSTATRRPAFRTMTPKNGCGLQRSKATRDLCLLLFISFLTLPLNNL